MQKFSFYFNNFKKYLLIFLKHLQNLEFLFNAIICINSLVALIGNLFVWTSIAKMDYYYKGEDLVIVFDLFSMSSLTIISGVVTVIIVNFFLNNVNNVNF
jgi:hypothetical protein